MKWFGAQAIVLLFAVLVVACAFDDVGAKGQPAGPFQEEGTICTVLGTSAVGAVFSSRPVPQTPSTEIPDSRPDVHADWLLAQSIDHPPKRLG